MYIRFVSGLERILHVIRTHMYVHVVHSCRTTCILRNLLNHIVYAFLSRSFVISQVILCTKEVNEKTRVISFKLLIRMGYAAQRCYLGNAEGTNLYLRNTFIDNPLLY